MSGPDDDTQPSRPPRQPARKWYHGPLTQLSWLRLTWAFTLALVIYAVIAIKECSP